jgi:hypothetical protein
MQTPVFPAFGSLRQPLSQKRITPVPFSDQVASLMGQSNLSPVDSISLKRSHSGNPRFSADSETPGQVAARYVGFNEFLENKLKADLDGTSPALVVKSYVAEILNGRRIPDQDRLALVKRAGVVKGTELRRRTAATATATATATAVVETPSQVAARYVGFNKFLDKMLKEELDTLTGNSVVTRYEAKILKGRRIPKQDRHLLVVYANNAKGLEQRRLSAAVAQNRRLEAKSPGSSTSTSIVSSFRKAGVSDAEMLRGMAEFKTAFENTPKLKNGKEGTPNLPSGSPAFLRELGYFIKSGATGNRSHKAKQFSLAYQRALRDPGQRHRLENPNPAQSQAGFNYMISSGPQSAAATSSFTQPIQQQPSSSYQITAAHRPRPSSSGTTPSQALQTTSSRHIQPLRPPGTLQSVGEPYDYNYGGIFRRSNHVLMVQDYLDDDYTTENAWVLHEDGTWQRIGPSTRRSGR